MTKILGFLLLVATASMPAVAQEKDAGLRRTLRNVAYGEHPRNLMDVWLADSAQPTPILVSIHGGGFRGGNKGVDSALRSRCLEAGISVAAITYRLSDSATAPAQFHDAARAVQYLRYKAKAWNVDPRRIAATGGSAGAGLSLWLGFHDDMADPSSSDPVLRQSTRLTCMAVYNAQTSYDPRVIRKLFPETDAYAHPALVQLFGADLRRLDSLPESTYRLFEEVSPLHHLSEGDPPALLLYSANMDTKPRSAGVAIHHPRFGAVLKEKMDALGIECNVVTGVKRKSKDYTDRIFRFVSRHLSAE